MVGDETFAVGRELLVRLCGYGWGVFDCFAEMVSAVLSFFICSTRCLLFISVSTSTSHLCRDYLHRTSSYSFRTRTQTRLLMDIAPVYYKANVFAASDVKASYACAVIT